MITAKDYIICVSLYIALKRSDSRTNMKTTADRLTDEHGASAGCDVYFLKRNEARLPARRKIDTATCDSDICRDVTVKRFADFGNR
ncbi:hypothetical protein EVAR_27871_1 [Eumeta japonica]|uniref:Uncharacterized protein n=1 Tax=Eumeta variegata TaxID=151549 RepID=A0A4C1VJC5_EUMVA|nr:hypothetical protein EVAR_27871_1 [Eumeta japonica]